MLRLISVPLFYAAASVALAQTPTTVTYLANEGVMVTHDETSVLFDPLFANSYNQYQLVLQETREAIFAGRAPFDHVDAVFISHFHGDHFSAEDLLRLLRSRESIRLYAPAQAVAEMRAIAGDLAESVAARIVGLDLDYGDAPLRIRAGDLVVEAVHIPHSGWPTARTDVQNLAFRITLDDVVTVLHLGDADARTVHFETDQQYWEERAIDLALPPYWFFGNASGIEVLDNRIGVRRSVGIHVPASFANPGDIPEHLREFDLFTRPGEQRLLK